MASSSPPSSRETPSAGAGRHITKDNIHSFSYYQLFSLPDPVLEENAGRASPTPAIDATTLTRAYRRFSLLFHPDKDASPAARAAFEYVKAALDTLVDAEKRAVYDSERRPSSARAGEGGGVAGDDGGDAQARRRQQQAAEEAEWAAQVLRQREAQQAAAVVAKQQAAFEKEEAMRRMQAELTSSLDTPFAMMESQVIRDWDVDEELLEMKLRDVAKLLKELDALGGDGHEKKKRRVEAEA